MSSNGIEETVSQTRDQHGDHDSRLLGDQAEPDSKKKDPDEEDVEFLEGGYGWMIVAAAFYGRTISNMSLCFGLLLIVLHEYFGQSTAETALVGSSYYITALLAGPLASSLCNQIGHRATCMLGSLMCSLGFVISAFATSLIYLCISYGLLVGFGECLIYVSSTVMPNFYFKKRLKLAMGIVVTGTGIGVLVTPVILQYSIDYFTWRGAMFIAAGISLQGCVSGALFRPNQKSTKCKRKGKRKCKLSFKALSGMKELLSVLKQGRPLVFTTASYILCYSYSIFYTYFPSRATSYGYTADQAAVFLSIGGISSTVTRVLFAIVMAMTKPNLSIVYGFVIIFQSMAHFILLFRQPSYPVVAMSPAIFGIAEGMIASLYPLRLAELYGVNQMTNAIGWFILFEGTGDIIAPPVGGSIVDSTGGYIVCFIVSGIITVVAGIMNIPLGNKRGVELEISGTENVETEPPEISDSENIATELAERQADTTEVHEIESSEYPQINSSDSHL